MDLLRRSIAPILDEVWALLDEEARRALQVHLCARKLVDFKGPLGWSFAAVNTGRLTPITDALAADVQVGVRQVQPLVELRTPILLDASDFDAVGRGGKHLDLRAVSEAAQRLARAEDGAIFNGYPSGGITGIIAASPHAPIKVAGSSGFPRAVVEAQAHLKAAGVGGPWVLALGSGPHEEVSAATEEGYPISKQIERILMDGLVLHAPALQGGVLMSVRGGDYELTVGQDLSLGYARHDRDAVELFLTESFTFRVLEPAAAVHLQVSRGNHG